MPTSTAKNRRRAGSLFAAGLMVALVALVLSGCVAAGSPSGPSAPNNNASFPGVVSPLPPSAGLPGGESPAVSQPPSPVANPSAGATMPTVAVITQADDGKTLHFAVDQKFTLDLGANLEWTAKVADEQVVQPMKGLSLPAGVQGVYEAMAAGTTTLSAAGKAHCASGERCPLFMLAFNVTIVVD